MNPKDFYETSVLSIVSFELLGNMSNNYFTITQTGMQTIPKKSTYRLNQG